MPKEVVVAGRHALPCWKVTSPGPLSSPRSLSLRPLCDDTSASEQGSGNVRGEGPRESARETPDSAPAPLRFRLCLVDGR